MPCESPGYFIFHPECDIHMSDGCIRFHRAHFLDAFVDNLPNGVAHFGKRLTSYTQSNPTGPIMLQFADNTAATCDILVGCDGIKSLIRAEMLTAKAKQDRRPDLLDYIEPIWSGTIAYRGLIPIEDLSRGEDKPPHRAIDIPMMVILPLLSITRVRGLFYTASFRSIVGRVRYV